MFTAIRRWYHARCIAANRAEIADTEVERTEKHLDFDRWIALTHWIDDCERSIRHHETRLNQLAPLDNVSQPTNER